MRRLTVMALTLCMSIMGVCAIGITLCMSVMGMQAFNARKCRCCAVLQLTQRLLLHVSEFSSAE